MTLFLELNEDMPEQWRCREPSDILGGLLCGRRRHEEGDHAELAAGHPQVVTIWPAT